MRFFIIVPFNYFYLWWINKKNFHKYFTFLTECNSSFFLIIITIFNNWKLFNSIKFCVVESFKNLFTNSIFQEIIPVFSFFKLYLLEIFDFYLLIFLLKYLLFFPIFSSDI